VADHRIAPVNTLGYLRAMFAVDDLDETLARVVREFGAELVSKKVVQYEDAYRLWYIGAGRSADRARAGARLR